MLPDLRSLTLECTRHGAEVGASIRCTEIGVTGLIPNVVSQAVYEYLQNHPKLVDTLTQDPLSDGIKDEEVWNRMIYYWDHGTKKSAILPEKWKSGPTSLIAITPKCPQERQTRNTQKNRYVIYVLKATLYMQFSEQRRKNLDSSTGFTPNYPSMQETRPYPQGYKEPEYSRTFIVPTWNDSNSELSIEMDNVLKDFLHECQRYPHRSDLDWHPETNSLYNTTMDDLPGHNPFPVGECGWEDPQADPDGELWWGAAMVDNVARDPLTGAEILPDPNANAALPDPPSAPLEYMDEDDEDDMDEDDIGSGSGGGYDEDHVDMLLRQLRNRPETHENPVPILEELNELMGDPGNAMFLGAHSEPVVDAIRCAHVHQYKTRTINVGLAVLIGTLSPKENGEDEDAVIAAGLLTANVMPVLVDLLLRENLEGDTMDSLYVLLSRLFHSKVGGRAVELFNERRRLGLSRLVDLFLRETRAEYYAPHLTLMMYILQKEGLSVLFATELATFEAVIGRLRTIKAMQESEEREPLSFYEKIAIQSAEEVLALMKQSIASMNPQQVHELAQRVRPTQPGL